MNNTPCEYGKHNPRTSRMYHYWDDNNGLPEKGVKICAECYAAHILKFYPESKIAKHIRENPDEYKNKIQTITFQILTKNYPFPSLNRLT